MKLRKIPFLLALTVFIGSNSWAASYSVVSATATTGSRSGSNLRHPDIETISGFGDITATSSENFPFNIGSSPNLTATGSSHISLTDNQIEVDLAAQIPKGEPTFNDFLAQGDITFNLLADTTVNVQGGLLAFAFQNAADPSNGFSTPGSYQLPQGKYVIFLADDPIAATGGSEHAQLVITFPEPAALLR